MTVLVTGGTGTLGRPTVERLRGAGHDVRVFSRTAGDGHLVGDLSTGAGLTTALDGVTIVLHLANGSGKEAEHTGRLIAALPTSVNHLVYISIVGVDRNPFGYYRQKIAAERAVEASGVPFTILRATQFHQFISNLIDAQRSLPIRLAPKLPLQPISVEEVADRLVELVGGAPAGHVTDIEGPEQAAFAAFARTWLDAHGRRTAIWRFRFPGKAGRAFRDGVNMGRIPGFGRVTFAEYARAEVAAGR